LKDELVSFEDVHSDYAWHCKKVITLCLTFGEVFEHERRVDGFLMFGWLGSFEGDCDIFQQVGLHFPANTKERLAKWFESVEVEMR
jgi:hypothetical protein